MKIKSYVSEHSLLNIQNSFIINSEGQPSQVIITFLFKNVKKISEHLTFYNSLSLYCILSLLKSGNMFHLSMNPKSLEDTSLIKIYSSA